MLRDALFLQLGYNATLVTLGATILGISAGVCGAFLFLRKRAVVSAAISHATLPGVALAFILMVSLGFDGRWLPGLLLGSLVSAALGLGWLSYLSNRTRLTEDAAIGAVLSVFFGFGIVVLTIVQSMAAGRQAGLEDFLLGATAGMLRSEAWMILVGGVLALITTLAFRRKLLMVSFDPGYAQSRGVSLSQIDALLLTLVLFVTVIGLKIVGLILIVALLIIPAAAARFWSERTDVILLCAGAIGGLSGYLGTAVSATNANAPTGPVIVIVSFALFAASFFFAPERGILAELRSNHQFQTKVHVRQGLIALSQGQDVLEPRTRKLLIRREWLREDGVVTEQGQAAVRRVVRDEARWRQWRLMQSGFGARVAQTMVDPIDTVLTDDEIAALDKHIGLKGV